MTTSGSVVGAPVLLLSFLASIDLFSSSLINVASVACAGLRPACRHPSGAGGFSIHPPPSEMPAHRDMTDAGAYAVGKPWDRQPNFGKLRRKLVSVPG